jgi:hypothetical protein
MANFTFPRNSESGNQANLRPWAADLGVGDYIKSGFVMSGTGGLGISVSAGVAYAQGTRLERTTAITGTLTDAATNHVFITLDENASNTLVLTLNTSGTAPTTPYLKLGTVVTAGGAITSFAFAVGLRVQSNAQSLYDRVKNGLAGEHLWETPIVFCTSAAGGLTGPGFRVWTPAVGSAGYDTMDLGGLTGAAGTASTTDMGAGDVLKACCAVNAQSGAWTLVSANNLLGPLLLSVAVDWTTNGTANRRIQVGIDSGGVVKVVTCDGSAVTTTSTGFTLVSGRKTHIDLVFTKGTNVVVNVGDGIQADTTTTITATLPTRLPQLYLGRGPTASGTVSQTVYPGAVSIKTV